MRNNKNYFGLKNGKNKSGKYQLTCGICNEILYSDIEHMIYSSLTRHVRNHHKLSIKNYEFDIPENFVESYKKYMTSFSRRKLRDPEVAENHGYEVLSIWTSEIKKNKYRVLEECRKFLLS